MYTGKHAHLRPLQPAFIMAGTGEIVTYRELNARSNRLAQLFRQRGLQRLDHYSIFMENNNRYLEACGAGERSGLYFTCVNSFLTAGELAYILTNSQSRVLITSKLKLDVAREALKECPKIELCIVVDGSSESDRIVGLKQATAGLPATAIADESLGTAMLYSSGTTGRPKGIVRPLPEQPPEQNMPLFDFLIKLWHYREGMVYLSPAPLYHSAPQAAVGLTIRMGGTVIVMERFDAEHYLQLVEKHRVTHSQLVPTMFSRLLKLPDEVRRRYDLSSLETVIHAAAPCPVQVKEQMIDWWGPIIHEYYGATEGLGFTACDSAEWLAHRGTVGRVLLGELAVLDDDMQPLPMGTPGTLWFKTATPFEYFNDPAKTAMGGYSLGGLASAYAGLRDPETFGLVLSQSGSYWFEPTKADYAEPNWLVRQFAASKKLPLRFYMDAGTNELDLSSGGGGILVPNRHLRDVLMAKGYEVHYQEFVGDHDYINWRGTLADGLINLLGSSK